MMQMLVQIDGTLRVLVVEDEPVAATLLVRQICTLFPSAEVEKVATVQDACSWLERGNFDLCFLDMFLGEQMGLEVLDHLLYLPVSTAVIIMTAHSRQDLAAEGLTRGAYDYLIKGKYSEFDLEKSIGYAIYRRRREIEMEALAVNDHLTGLVNRAGFSARLDEAIQRANHQGAKLALMYLDIDKFKPVNDTYGHTAGDVLLKAIADRMVGGVRKTDTCARLGGDEFAAILEGIGEIDNAERVAHTVLHRIIAPYAVLGHMVEVGCSIGVAYLDETDGTAEALTNLADQRMYTAKAEGGNRVLGPRDVHPDKMQSK